DRGLATLFPRQRHTGELDDVCRGYRECCVNCSFELVGGGGGGVLDRDGGSVRERSAVIVLAAEDAERRIEAVANTDRMSDRPHLRRCCDCFSSTEEPRAASVLFEQERIGDTP